MNKLDWIYNISILTILIGTLLIITEMSMYNNRISGGFVLIGIGYLMIKIIEKQEEKKWKKNKKTKKKT